MQRKLGYIKAKGQTLRNNGKQIDKILSLLTKKYRSSEICFGLVELGWSLAQWTSSQKSLCHRLLSSAISGFELLVIARSRLTDSPFLRSISPEANLKVCYNMIFEVLLHSCSKTRLYCILRSKENRTFLHKIS